MKPESARQLRAANEAAMAVLTLMTAEENDIAMDLVASDDTYSNKLVVLVLAMYATSSLKTLASVLNSDPMDLVKTMALINAQYILDMEKDT